jgi:hypothetical protein
MVSELDEVITVLRSFVVGDCRDAGENASMVTATKLRWFALVLLLAALEVRDAWEQSGRPWEGGNANQGRAELTQFSRLTPMEVRKLRSSAI